MFRSKDEVLEEAITFMESQRKLNKKNYKILKTMNVNIGQDEYKDWDRIYKFVIKKLKSLRK